jgi:hypothetical protein
MRRYGLVIMALVAAVGIGACDEDNGDEDSNEYEATLSGAAERPNPNNEASTGSFTLTDNGGSMSYVLTVNNLVGTVSGAHIHAVPRSGVAAADTTGGIVVNLNPSAGVTTGTLAQGTITQANILGLGGAAPISMDSLRTLINAGRTYVNVHTTPNYAPGLIRGTIVRD